MRIPTSNGAGQRGTRRRGRAAADPGSDRDTAGPDANRASDSRDTGRRYANSDDSSALGPSGTGTRTESSRHGARPASSGDSLRSGSSTSVFAPGYDASRPDGDGAQAQAGTQGPPSWYGTTAGGKGPVRGFAPAPGQPPPMYPPGQFAAWNVDQDSRARPGSRPGPADRNQQDGGFSGRSRQDLSQPDQTGPQPAQPADANSRYYDSSGTEPGYSVLAVSDPAADVTSTQTWQAVGDGRSTGTWKAPVRPGAAPGGQPVMPSRRGPEPGGPGTEAVSGPQPGTPRAASGRHSAVLDTAGPGTATPGRARRNPDSPASASPDGASLDNASPASASPDSASRDGQPRRSRGRSGAHTGPHAAVPTERGPQAEPRPARGKSPASGKRSASRKRPASVKFAISVALLLVLVAAGTLAYTVLHTVARRNPTSSATKQPQVTPSASQSPSLGPYGHIASRQSDPQPLTIAQLFPASFTINGQAVTLAASAISRHCGAAVSGSNLQSAASSAHCDQAVRATYLARAQGLMGTVGVLNLDTAARATKAAKRADASDYINQLKGKRGPTRRIGNGTGVEEAFAKGHYLILLWAEFTNLHKPKTKAQRREVVTFMTELLDNTANLSLTTRYLNGNP